MRESRSDATSPAISEIARPWKIGSNRMTRGADDHGGGGEHHRAEAHRARVDDGLLERHALAQPQLDEVDQDDRVAHHDAGAGDEADHRRGREERAHRRVRRQDADQRERNRRHDQERRRERLEPADDQDVDQDAARRANARPRSRKTS